MLNSQPFLLLKQRLLGKKCQFDNWLLIMVNAEMDAIGINRRQQVARLSFLYRNNLQKKECTRKVTAGFNFSGMELSDSKFLIVTIVNKMKMLAQTMGVKILSRSSNKSCIFGGKRFFCCNMQNYWEKENVILAKIFTSLLHH